MTDVQRQKAYEHYAGNRYKITKSVEKVKEGIKPNSGCINVPMLWKPKHWYWFITH